MFSTPKLDSTPPTRQPSPAPSFPGANLPSFSSMDQMHRAQAPLIGGGVRGMFPPGAHPGAHPHHHSTYLRPHIPMHHGPPPDLQMPMRFTNATLSRSHSQYGGGGGAANNNSNHVKRSNSYSNSQQTPNNSNNNHYHQSFIQNNMQQPPTNLTSFTHSRSALDTIPLRMQHLARHIDTRKAPEKVSPSNFSPTTAFSPEAFSPNKIMVNHSSPPDAVGDTQNNSSYGSHEDTLTYEPSVDQTDYPPSQQQTQQNQHGSFHQGHASAAANLLHELALSPGSNQSGQQQQQHRQNERSRSSSGSYNDHVMNRNATVGNGGNVPGRIMMDKKDLMSKESMDLMYLRNIQHLSQPTSSYHPSLHDLEKTRLDTRSPHGIHGPPPGYNPMQVVGNLPFPSSIHTLLYNPRPGLISPLQPQQLIRGFPSSPTQSDDESDDDRQQ